MKFLKMLNLKGQQLPTFKKKLWKVFILFTLFIVMIKALVALVNYGSARYACHAGWVDSSIESKYTVRGGCLVKVNGTWIPAKNFRIN